MKNILEKQIEDIDSRWYAWVSTIKEREAIKQYLQSCQQEIIDAVIEEINKFWLPNNSVSQSAKSSFIDNLKSLK